MFWTSKRRTKGTASMNDETQRDADIAAADRLAECYRIVNEIAEARAAARANTLTEAQARLLAGKEYSVIQLRGRWLVWCAESDHHVEF
jgi:hypothetical protein